MYTDWDETADDYTGADFCVTEANTSRISCIFVIHVTNSRDEMYWTIAFNTVISS